MPASTSYQEAKLLIHNWKLLEGASGKKWLFCASYLELLQIRNIIIRN